MTQAGLIINPRSGQSSGRGLALADKLRGSPDVITQILDSFDDLSPALERMAQAGVSRLFISSGDGTIHAIQTELAESRLFERLPALGLLPHGTTNMTAADIGLAITSIEAQADYILRSVATVTKQRPTIRAVNPRDGKPRHGMFIGTGAVSEASLFCQKTLNKRGIKGDWAAFATLAAAALKTVFKSPDPTDTERFDRPFNLVVETGGETMAEGTQLLLLATTLDKLILGTRPFWGGKTGPIRASVFPYPVPSLPRWLFTILYGNEERTVPNGARSFSAEQLTVVSPVSYVIDGEFFDGPAHEALRLETGPMFTYLCG